MKRERGSVTAESALVLPLVAGFGVVVAWLVSLGIAQVRTVDAARDAARALARGDDERQAVAIAQRTAPEGAEISFTESESSVTVSVTFRAKPPGWLLMPMPEVSIGSESTVELEDDVADR